MFNLIPKDQKFYEELEALGSMLLLGLPICVS